MVLAVNQFQQLDQLYDLFGTLLVSLPEVADTLESVYQRNSGSMHLLRAHQHMTELMQTFDTISTHLIAYRKGDTGLPERKTWAEMHKKQTA